MKAIEAARILLEFKAIERPKTGVRPAILAIRNYEIVLILNRWRAQAESQESPV